MAFLRGGILVKTMLVEHSLVFGTITVSDTIKEKTTYPNRVEQALVMFQELILTKLTEITSYLDNQIASEEACGEYHEWLQEAIQTKKWFDTKGRLVFVAIIEALGKKHIDHESYQYINQVITNHEDIAKIVFQEKISLQSLETMIAYISEVPGELEFDIDIQSLPSRQKEPGYRIHWSSDHEVTDWRRMYELPRPV